MTESRQSNSLESIEFQGCVGLDGKPFIVVSVNGAERGQLTPGEALNLGIRAIQASIEGERDSALVVGAAKAGLGKPEIAAMIKMTRDFRGQVDPDPRDDVPPPREETG